MSVLSGPAIATLIESAAHHDGAPVLPYLSISPYNASHIGPNSYDLTLAPHLLTYPDLLLDMRRAPVTQPLYIPEEGYILQPGVLYLGATVERIEAHGLVPWIDGRSSIGRLGIQVHMTAGRADDGFAGNLTLEITCVQSVRIYPYTRIAQLTLFTLEGERKPYSGRYLNSVGPVPSRFSEG